MEKRNYRRTMGMEYTPSICNKGEMLQSDLATRKIHNWPIYNIHNKQSQQWSSLNTTHDNCINPGQRDKGKILQSLISIKIIHFTSVKDAS